MAWAQDYTPFSRSFPDSAAILAQNEFHLETTLESIKSPRSLRVLHQNRHDRFVGQLRRQEFVNDPALNAFMGGLLEEILVANPEIQAGSVHLYMGGEGWPNAYCTGTGNFVFNLGLLRRLENESQIAFVLCHELAHYQLNHVDRAMRTHCERLESDATKEKLKEIKRMEYGARAEALDLVEGLVFESRRHSRYAESSADSLGLVYLLRTRFNPHDAITCLAILDEIDQPKYDFPFDPQLWFPHPQYPFRERWQPESNPFIHQEKQAIFNKDSLKTHPACPQRIAQLAPQVSGQPTHPNTQAESLAQLIERADFELVANHFRNGDIGEGMFAAQQLLRVHPRHPWLLSQIGRGYFILYLGRRDHVLNRHLQRVDPRKEGPYQEFLGIHNQLRMSEMAKAGFFFLHHHYPHIQSHEMGLAAYIRLAEACGKSEPAQVAHAAYSEQFPHGTSLTTLQP